MASKDVQGRTIPKGQRGQITGASTAVSGVVAIAVGLALRAIGPDVPPGVLAAFLAGAALGWFLLPHAVTIFISFTPDAAANFIDARTYLTFCMRLVLAFGIAFLFPVVMVILNLLGVVRGSTFLRGWRWAVVLIFTFAAFANPLPDPWTMIALGLIMVGLYYGTIGLCVLHDRRRDRRAAQRDADLGIG